MSTPEQSSIMDDKFDNNNYSGVAEFRLFRSSFVRYYYLSVSEVNKRHHDNPRQIISIFIYTQVKRENSDKKISIQKSCSNGSDR
jgi:hypothetical protein